MRLLEDLSLFSNRITVLEGLDTLENLNVLSVGSNHIQSLDDSVRYLHKLRNNLEVLKINNNDFKETGDKEYKRRIIAYLKNLKYLDYQLIEDKEHEKAIDDYKTELETTNLENEETKDNTEAKEAYRQLEEAHIHYTHNFFQSCCKGFVEYEKISGFNKYAEVWAYTEGTIEEAITTFQGSIKTKHQTKKKILAFCNEKMRQSERDAEIESINKIEAYKKQEKHMFREIAKKRADAQDTGRQVEYDSYENRLQDLIVTLKGDLLHIEMNLSSALDKARGDFRNEINKINEEMTKDQNILSGSISVEFQTFGQKLKEELNKEKEQFQYKYEQDEVAALEEYGVTSIEAGGVLEIIADDQNKDAVDELVTLFIESIEGVASAKDSAMTKDRNTEWTQMYNSLSDAQLMRDREIVSEIISTTNNFSNAISKSATTPLA